MKTQEHDAGPGEVDAGLDAPPDAPPNVIAELIGIWDITVVDSTESGCTATFTDGILIECINDPQTTGEIGCLRQSTIDITGDWHASLGLTLEESEDYSGTCADPAHIDSSDVFASMNGMRVSGMPSAGLWSAAGGTWHVDATDPEFPDMGVVLACDAAFTPAGDQATIDVTCQTRWDDDDGDGCQQRGTYHITATYQPTTVSIVFNGQSEKQGASCIAPLVEAFTPTSLNAAKR